MAEERAAASAGQYEQSRDAASAEVDRLVGILQARAGEVGERQALADVCALTAGRETAELAGLLTAALGRLAGVAKAT